MNEYFAAGGGSCNKDVAAINNSGREGVLNLDEAVLSLLQANWLEREPSEQCFDHDALQMDSAYSLLRGEFDSEDAKRAQDHLVSCSRCRFIFGTLRSETPRLCGTVPDILRKHLHSDGRVVFPGGEIAEETWEFGLLNELPRDVSEDIVEIIAEQAASKLKCLYQRDTIIVCFSNPIHRCGKRLASKLVETGNKHIHVVMADDFFNPKLWCDPHELNEKHVVIFVDVVHSGGLLRRLCEAARIANPQELIGLAVIDQSKGKSHGVPLIALWGEPPERRALHLFQHETHQGAARFFDPASGRARSRHEVPNEVGDRHRAQLTIEQYLRELGPLFPHIQESGALQSDKVIGGVCYPWVVDLLRLLEHEQARVELVSRAKVCLETLAECGSWCLVYPAERSKRAGVWAKAIGLALGWPVIGIGLSNRRHYRPLTARQRRELGKYSGAVIVDAAIRTGKTLESFIDVLGGGDTPLIKQVVPFYAFDGLFADARSKLELETGTSILSLFRLPLGAPTDSVGKHCRRYFSDTLLTLDNSLLMEGWTDVVKTYCKKKLAPSQFPSKSAAFGNAEAGLLRALDEGKRGAEARLERSCVNPRPSMVKQLDVSYALQEPRTRNVLHGFLCNSMPNDFIEWCALALSTQDDFEWFDKDWLVLHKQIMINPKSERWQFLVFIGYRMKQQGNRDVLSKAHSDVQEFRRSQGPYPRTLFPEIEDPEIVQSRCNVLLGVLSA